MSDSELAMKTKWAKKQKQQQCKVAQIERESKSFAAKLFLGPHSSTVLCLYNGRGNAGAEILGKNCTLESCGWQRCFVDCGELGEQTNVTNLNYPMISHAVESAMCMCVRVTGRHSRNLHRNKKRNVCRCQLCFVLFC